jgi:hypothetical protein
MQKPCMHVTMQPRLLTGVTNACMRFSVGPLSLQDQRASEHDLGKSLFSASTSFFLLLGEGGRRSIVSHPLTWASRDMLSDPDVLTTVRS